MKNDNLDNYYQIDAYCRSEGMDTEYFISSSRAEGKSRNRGRKDVARAGKMLAMLAIPVLFFIVIASGCAPTADELSRIDYAPYANGEWEVSTPKERGLDPMLVARLYYKAEEVGTV